ncbi:MAG TPA: SUMF1/EgtB/PvdO family nonheme iron enzyme, partial [Candidatus Eremiobacteraceae bacterium]|nr:SUMF1/EgtB/PvdO family nonheme iron enzyme [Candidatus Eremiobacteraceae bacterium]
MNCSGFLKRSSAAALMVLLAALTVACTRSHDASAHAEGMLSTSTPDKSTCLSSIPSKHLRPPASKDHPDMVWIPGGEFSMGSNNPKFSDARPWHRVRLSGFWIDRTTVTNEQFARFVRATGYVTVAERRPLQKDFPGVPAQKLVAGSLVFTPPDHPVELNNDSQWWRYVHGANWRHPQGPKSSIAGQDRYPVVQIAYEDAQAYARWMGKRLPTEAEYEFAERGGMSCKQFAWGDVFSPAGRQMANTFHGHFP